VRNGLTYLAAALAGGVAVVAIAGPPTATADQAPSPATPTVTVTVPAPGPQDSQSCNSSATATKCVKNGDAEINAGIPAPYPGPFGVYGPYWAG
jgi:hypothetical protein